MIISKEHHFIFIAVPKTGTSACEFVLRRHGDFYKTGRQRHMPAQMVRAHLGEDWNSYRSYAVVRHPVDWLHSWYKFWSAATKNPKPGIAAHNHLPEMPFAEFVGRTLENRNRHWTDVSTQAARICDDRTGEVLVSQLLCFDHLAAQFPQMQISHGLPVTALPKKNISEIQQPLPKLPEKLMAEVRRFWGHDFVLYSRAYYNFADDLASSGEPVPSPKFELLTRVEVADAESRIAAECKARKLRPLAASELPELHATHPTDDESALVTAREAAKQTPHDAGCHLHLGNLLLKAGEVDAAAEALRRTISLNPNMVKAYQLLSRALLKRGDVEQAVAMAREAVERAPNSLEMLKHLVKTLRKQGNKKEAIAVLKRIAEFHLNLGTSLLKAGKIEAAIESLRQAMAQNPNLMKAYRLLSEALLYQGDVEQAVAMAREAVARAPNRPELLKHLAHALRKQGNKKEAAAVLKRAAVMAESADATRAADRQRSGENACSTA